jgi:transcriptional regulator with XRE-family HTH domain
MSILTRIFYACVASNACGIDIYVLAEYKQTVTRDPIYRLIGAVIKARRKTLGLKQEALASELGISRGSLANIETGRQSILVHQLYKFAAALSLTAVDLLPPAPRNDARIARTELPLPHDLKAQERAQITRFFQEIDTDQDRDKEANRAKHTK